MKMLLLLLAVATTLSCHAQNRIGNTLSGDFGNVFVNHEYVPHKYKKVVIVSPVLDEKLNRKISYAFSDLKVTLVDWTTILPPVKEYSDEERKAIYEEYDIDGVINIRTIGVDRRTIGFAATTRVRFESEFIDLTTGGYAAKFTGQATLGSLSINPERAVYQWAKLISPEIESLLRK